VLWDAVIGAVDIGEADAVAYRLKRLYEAREHAVSLQLRDIFHAHHVGANTLDQIREVVKHSPFLVALLCMPARVPGKWLARRAPNENLGRALRVSGEQFAARHVGDIGQFEFRVIVRFKRVTTSRIEVDASGNRDTRPNQAVRKSTRSTEQVYGDGGVLLSHCTSVLDC